MSMTLLVGLLLVSPVGQGGSCHDFGFLQLLNGEPRSEYRGRYTNWTYHYSVVIPRGFTAYDRPDPANHQGFGLAFGEPEQSYVFVRAEHNSREFETPREAATRYLEYMQKKGQRIESTTMTESQLGMLKGVHVVVTYTCLRSGDRYVKSSIVSLSADKRFIYEIDLYSAANRYQNDQTVFDSIQESWSLISRSR